MVRNIKVIEEFSGYKENTVCFNTGSSQGDRYGFDSEIMNQSALRGFYERVILGESFPSQMILGRLDLEGIIAASFFSSPDLVLKGECSSLIHSFEMVRKLGDIGLSHISVDHCNLFLTVDNALNFSSHYNSSREKQKALQQNVQMITNYLRNGQLPPTKHGKDYTVIDSEDEFVGYESSDPAFYQQYRKGFLCGMWVDTNHKGEMVVFKKSQFVETIDLENLKEKLDEKDEKEWELDGGIMLKSPADEEEFLTDLTPEEVIGTILN